MPTTTFLSEADILEEVIAPMMDDLTPESARSLLRLKFSAATTKKIRKLLQLNNRGDITADDRLLLEKYLRVGRMLDVIQARAQLFLMKDGKPF